MVKTKCFFNFILPCYWLDSGDKFSGAVNYNTVSIRSTTNNNHRLLSANLIKKSANTSHYFFIYLFFFCLSMHCTYSYLLKLSITFPQTICTWKIWNDQSINQSKQSNNLDSLVFHAVHVPEFHDLLFPLINIREIVYHGDGLAPHPLAVVLPFAILVQLMGPDGTAGHCVVVQSATIHHYVKYIQTSHIIYTIKKEKIWKLIKYKITYLNSIENKCLNNRLKRNIYYVILYLISFHIFSFIIILQHCFTLPHR